MFNDLPLLLREPIKFIHQFVDLLIRRRNLPLDQGLLLVGPGLGKPLIEIEHPLDEGDHFIVAGNIGGIRGVDCANWEIFQVPVQKILNMFHSVLRGPHKHF